MNTQYSIIDNLITSAIQNDSTSEMLDRYGLNWQVSKLPLSLPDGTITPYFGIARQDKGTCFSTCKDSYVPYQNTELAELVNRIAEKTGYSIHNGGMFNGGAKVYIQLETGVVKGIGANNDSITKYVTALNSHDGSTSLRWGHTDITISCKNTFNAAYRDLKNSARHTDSIHSRVEQSLKEIAGLQKVEQAIFDTYFQLSETPVKKDDIIKAVKIVTDVDIQLTADQLKKDYSTYSINRMHDLLKCIDREMKQKGNTKWGLFAGVTNYTTHTIPAPQRENGRLESKYIGTGYRIDNEVFEMLRG